MSKSKKASQTADRAGDLYSAARENPYVQRLIEDDDLRDNLHDAFDSARSAYGRATGNGKGTVKAVTSDKKVQKDMRQAAENLHEAAERLKAPKKRKSRLGRLILLRPSRRRYRAGAQRGRPQDRPRHPLRCRRGVRVHELDEHQRLITGRRARRRPPLS